MLGSNNSIFLQIKGFFMGYLVNKGSDFLLKLLKTINFSNNSLHLNCFFSFPNWQWGDNYGWNGFRLIS